MATIHPLNDRVGIYDASANTLCETTPYYLVKAVLSAGTGTALSYDATNGRVTIASDTVVPFATASGSASAITGALSPALLSAPRAGTVVAVKLTAGITGATTFAPDGYGAASVVTISGAALSSGAYSSGELLAMIYDGSNWRVLGSSGTNPTSLPANAAGALTNDGSGGLAWSPAVGIGVGQTFQSLTSSRSLGVTYTNTTGKPIWVHVNGQADTNSASLLAFIDNQVLSGSSAGNSTYQVMLSAIIPAGSTYRFQMNVGGLSASQWTELR